MNWNNNFKEAPANEPVFVKYNSGECIIGKSLHGWNLRFNGMMFHHEIKDVLASMIFYKSIPIEWRPLTDEENYKYLQTPPAETTVMMYNDPKDTVAFFTYKDTPNEILAEGDIPTSSIYLDVFSFEKVSRSPFAPKEKDNELDK